MKKCLISLVIVVATSLFISGCVTTTGSETATGGQTTAATGKTYQAGPKSQTVGIAAGAFNEFCEEEWEVGDTVKFSFTSSKPVVFNVHYHDAKHVKHYNIKDVLVDDFSAEFTMEDKYIHCGMWQNNSDSFVKLTYEIEVVKK